jgi:hypothetical protein
VHTAASVQRGMAACLNETPGGGPSKGAAPTARARCACQAAQAVCCDDAISSRNAERTRVVCTMLRSSGIMAHVCCAVPCAAALRVCRLADASDGAKAPSTGMHRVTQVGHEQHMPHGVVTVLAPGTWLVPGELCCLHSSHVISMLAPYSCMAAIWLQAPSACAALHLLLGAGCLWQWAPLTGRLRPTAACGMCPPHPAASPDP